MYVSEEQLHHVLKTIKENDGFLGEINSDVRAKIFGQWATVEVSSITGMDVQWTLTTEGKKKLRELNANVRWRKKYEEFRASGRGRPNHQTKDVVVPLTIEVLDALKSIRETGDPNTTKLDILARIRRHGIHAAKTIKGADGRDILVHGALADFKDGVWTLTDAGCRVEAGHVRKSECAQFTGKVR